MATNLTHPTLAAAALLSPGQAKKALSKAIGRGDEAGIVAALAAGASPDEPLSGRGPTPLELNISQPREGAWKGSLSPALLAAADFTRKNKGRSLAMHAAQEGHLQALRLFLTPQNAAEIDRHGNNLLMLAVKGFEDSREECARLALPFCDPKAVNKNHETALTLAAPFSVPGCIRLLLPLSDAEHRAPRNDSRAIESFFMDFSGPPGYLECLEMVAGATDLSATDRQGFDALMRAADCGPEEAVEFLLKRCDPTRRSLNGQTALLAAAANENTHVLDLLLKVSDPRAVDHRGRSAFAALYSWKLANGSAAPEHHSALDKLAMSYPEDPAALAAARENSALPLPLYRRHLEWLAAKNEAEILSETVRGAAAEAPIEPQPSRRQAAPRAKLRRV